MAAASTRTAMTMQGKQMFSTVKWPSPQGKRDNLFQHFTIYSVDILLKKYIEIVPNKNLNLKTFKIIQKSFQTNEKIGKMR